MARTLGGIVFGARGQREEHGRLLTGQGQFVCRRTEVEALLALGNLSELGATPESCVAYHRDKGEDLAPATEYPNYPAMTQACFKQSGGEFLYVWEDGAWLCNSKPLAPVLAKAGLLPAQPEAAPAGPDWAVLGPRLAAALKGAQKALRESLPMVSSDEGHNGVAVFVGEWLDEVNEVVALLPAPVLTTSQQIRVRACQIICNEHPEWGTWGVMEDKGEYFEIHGDRGGRVLFKSEADQSWSIVTA